MVESKKQKEKDNKVKDVLIDSFQIKEVQLRRTNKKMKQIKEELGLGE